MRQHGQGNPKVAQVMAGETRITASYGNPESSIFYPYPFTNIEFVSALIGEGRRRAASVHGYDRGESALDFFVSKDRRIKGQVTGSFLGVSLNNHLDGNRETGLSVLAASSTVMFIGPKNGVKIETVESVPRLNLVDEDGNTLRSIH